MDQQEFCMPTTSKTNQVIKSEITPTIRLIKIIHYNQNSNCNHRGRQAGKGANADDGGRVGRGKVRKFKEVQI